jgi:hypothetical protein
MPRKVNVLGSWRAVQRQYVNVAGIWRLVQRQYVNVGGTWRFAWARNPSPPQSATLTVNGSSSNLTVSASPVTLQANWSTPSTETTLPVQVFWEHDAVTTALAAGTTGASRSISIAQGQTIAFRAQVRYRNGDPGSVSANDVYSDYAFSNQVSATYAAPSITNIALGVNYASDVITLSWTGLNAPAGATYRVLWSDSYQNTAGGTLGTLTSVSRNLTFAMHGYDLLEFQQGNDTLVTFTFDIAMFESNGTTPVTSGGSQVTGSIWQQIRVAGQGGGGEDPE